MILPRLLTAIIGIPVVLIAIKFGAIPYFILILTVTCFALKEYFFLANQAKYETHSIIGFIIGILFVMSVYFNGSRLTNLDIEFQLTSIVLSISIFILFLVSILFSSPSGSIGKIGTTLLALFLICWPYSHMLLIRDIRPYGDKYTYFLFLYIWFVDTGAYLVGTKFGKHKLAEKISPKKTVEGLFGAFIFGIIGSLILWKLLGITTFTGKEIVLVGILITTLCILSDLAESLIKRDANIKDSDVLLPGHGGMLDRFDSFIFTAPIFYYYLIIFHK